MRRASISAQSVLLVALAGCGAVEPSPTYLHTDFPDPPNGEQVVTDGGTGPLSCPLRAVATGGPSSHGDQPSPLACYGACGPGCMGECEQSYLTTTREVVADDGSQACVRCRYQLVECKSHAFCRWHDDCYRQCDQHWMEQHGRMPSRMKMGGCYRACDAQAAVMHPFCAADWTQSLDPSVQLQGACWDGSYVPFTRLVGGPDVDAGQCSLEHERHSAPFDGHLAQWDPSWKPPFNLPRDGPCLHDTDCPDRNQRCSTVLPQQPWLKAPGRCVDAQHSRHVDVAPLMPEGTVSPGHRRRDGQDCSLDNQCSSGYCQYSTCTPVTP